MSQLDRRGFLGAATAAGVGAASRGEAKAADAIPAASSPPGPPLVTLGPTGIRTTRLAMGTGVRASRKRSRLTRLGFEGFVDLIHHAYKRGVRFFDLADWYGSHPYFREALRTIPRDDVTILTKLWWRADGPGANTSASHREQVTRSAVNRFCVELQVERLDIVLLHCLTDPRWPETMKPYLAALDEERAAGKVRAVGVSCHDFDALKAAAASPWVEVILARTNPTGVKMDAAPAEVEAVLADASAAGKSIVGMKIFGEGTLVDRREECIRYAQSQRWMDAMTIGFQTPDQIDEALDLMAKHPVEVA